jgi:hypothetical protein
MAMASGLIGKHAIFKKKKKKKIKVKFFFFNNLSEFEILKLKIWVKSLILIFKPKKKHNW